MTDTDIEPEPAEPPPREPADLDKASHGHRHRRGLLTIGALALLIVLAGGGVIGRYVFRSHPGARSVDSAVDDFRSASSTVDSGPVGFVRPTAGVYQAAGEGEERISKPPNSQSDGATMPISVTYVANGCWTWHIDYNAAHWHEFDFCPAGGELLLVGQRNFQSWDFGFMKAENLGTYSCDPPAPIVAEAATVGASFQHHCTGDNTAAPGPSTSEGPATIVGTETISIGGVDVATVHQTRRQAMSGTQVGQIDEDWWYAADTGLPVRSERHYQVDTASVIGAISYTEQGSWQLTSMEPRT